MIPAWVGVWVLASAVSADNPDAPRVYSRATKHISTSDSTLTIVDDLVRLRGGVVHTEWTGTLDGKDYAVEGVEIDLTSAYTVVNEHTLELTQKVDGRPVVRATMILSADGNTITTTTTDGMTTTTTVYRKRGT